METSEADNEAIEDAGGLEDIVERYSTPPLSPDDVFAGALARHALRLTRERDEARAEVARIRDSERAMYKAARLRDADEIGRLRDLLAVARGALVALGGGE